MGELVHGSTAGAAGLVVAALVAVAAVVWWWPRSVGSDDRASLRRMVRSPLADTQMPGSSDVAPPAHLSGPSTRSDPPDPYDPSHPYDPFHPYDPYDPDDRSGLHERSAPTVLSRWSSVRSTDPPDSAIDRGRPAARQRRRGWGRPEPTARGPTTDEVAAGMVLLAVALQSGCGVVEAIEAAAAVAPDAAGHELAVVAAALRWGVADDQAWGAVSPAWRRTAVALRLAARSGVAPSTLLLSGAQDLRANRLGSIEVASARLGVRLVGPLGLAFLPAFVLTTVVPVVVAVASQVLSS